MGATTFEAITYGENAEAAFDAAHTDAQYEDGHNGYTGNLGSKHSFTVLTNTVMWMDDALKFARNLIDSSDPRVNDKWGPAGAVPFANPTRRAHVTLENVHKSNVDKAAAKAAGLARGETFVSARFNGGMTQGDLIVRGQYEVRIQRAVAPKERTVTVTLKAPAGGPSVREWSWASDTGRTYAPETEEGRDWFRTAIAAKVRLRAGETVKDFTITGADIDWKVKAEAPAGKTTTRYIVKGSQRHGEWATGFGSQAEARAYIVDALTNAPRLSSESYEIESITRREDGSPLVRVTRAPGKATYTVEVTVTTTPPAPVKPEGWLFFGWAPE